MCKHLFESCCLSSWRGPRLGVTPTSAPVTPTQRQVSSGPSLQLWKEASLWRAAPPRPGVAEMSGRGHPLLIFLGFKAKQRPHWPTHHSRGGGLALPGTLPGHPPVRSRPSGCRLDRRASDRRNTAGVVPSETRVRTDGGRHPAQIRGRSLCARPAASTDLRLTATPSGPAWKGPPPLGLKMPQPGQHLGPDS